MLALESCYFMKTSGVSKLEKVSRFYVCIYTYVCVCNTDTHINIHTYLFSPFYLMLPS